MMVIFGSFEEIRELLRDRFAVYWEGSHSRSKLLWMLRSFVELLHRFLEDRNVIYLPGYNKK